MSEPTSENKPVSNLQQLKAHHAHFCLQRDQAQMTYQQLVGAIFACEMMIKEEEEKIKKQFAEIVEKTKASSEVKEPTDGNQGAIDDGETKSEGTEQAA